MITKKTSISFTLSQVNLDFVSQMAKEFHLSKSAFVDVLLKSYKKQKLLKEFSQDAAEDSVADVSFVEGDFEDFINMVQNER